MADRIDLAALADEMDNAADAISKAATALRGTSFAPVEWKVVEALCGLWRQEGQLRGMADALRMVEARDAE